MKVVSIFPRKLSGRISIPPSKSYSHRSIICASLADGESVIKNICFSDDIKATINAMSSLGAEITLNNNSLFINGKSLFSKNNVSIDCNESASTLRFLIPIVSTSGVNAVFKGKDSLARRPIDVYTDCLSKHGVNIVSSVGVPVKVSGRLTPGIFELPGNISSQFISGLLLALPLLDGNSVIKLTTSLESSPYVDMTINTMSKFGVNVKKTDVGFKVPGGQAYKPCKYKVERDYSQAAFFMVAAVLGDTIKIDRLNKGSVQGDKKIIEILKQFGADVTWDKNTLIVNPSKTYGINVDVSQIPDLVPALTVIACFSEGTTNIINANRLRLKECNRLSALTTSLNKLGANIKETADGLIIKGVKSLKSGTVDSFNDHRIAMAISIASIRCDGVIRLTNAQSVNKSYPSFFNDFNILGGVTDVVNMGK